MYDFEKARAPEGSTINTGKPFGLSHVVHAECANSKNEKCLMRQNGKCLLDTGSRCEYFELTIIPLLVKRGGTHYESVKERYAKRLVGNQITGERVPSLCTAPPEARICPDCKKSHLKPRERICHSCWRKNRNSRERARRNQAYGHLTPKHSS
jgi:hypothetical protein